jgi:hypothetical protein
MSDIWVKHLDQLAEELQHDWTDLVFAFQSVQDEPSIFQKQRKNRHRRKILAKNGKYFL